MDSVTRCRHCQLPTKGGDYLPGHAARHVANLYSDVVHGRPLAEAMPELDGHWRLSRALSRRLGLDDLRDEAFDERLAVVKSWERS